MMRLLELVSDAVYHGFFVDLYVRCSNKVAIGMYEGLGYSVYRRVREYYGSLGPGGRDEEDAFGEYLSRLQTTFNRTTVFQTCASRYLETRCVDLCDPMVVISKLVHTTYPNHETPPFYYTSRFALLVECYSNKIIIYAYT